MDKEPFYADPLQIVHTISEAIALLKDAGISKPGRNRPPTGDELARAEAALGITLPPSFKTFLAQAGDWKLPYWETFWVGDDSLGYQNIIEANRSEHEDASSNLPPFLITFHNNGMGDQSCFDTRCKDSTGEYPIVFWRHELSAEEHTESLSESVVADNFADWLFDEIQTSRQ